MVVNEQSRDKRISDISLILRDLLKVIKVVSMYPENNPLPQSLKRSFAEKLESIIEDYGEIRLVINKENLTFEDDIVYENKSEEDNLAEIFFDAGVTVLTFKIGLQVEEIYRFLDTLKIYMNSSDKTLDLITLIWEAEISQVSMKNLEDVALTNYDEKFDLQNYIEHGSSQNYSTMDDDIKFDRSVNYDEIFHQDNDRIETGYGGSAEGGIEGSPGEYYPQTERHMESPPPPEGASIFYTGDEYGSGNYQITESDEITLNIGDAISAMGFDDLPAGTHSKIPDTTLILNDEFRLSEEEEEIIRVIIKEDSKFDPFESIRELIKEMLLQETEMNGFYETVTIAEKVSSEFISSGRLAEVSSIFNFLKKLDSKIRNKKPLWAERLKDAVTSFGSRERLGSLAEALNKHEEIGSEELSRYISNFDWEALNGISDIAGSLVHDHHKECISTYLTEKGKNNVDVVAKGIFDKNPEMVINSVDILTKIADDKAVKYLHRAAEHKDQKVRLALAKSLKNCDNEECLFVLQKLARDTSSEVRNAAVDSIVDRRSVRAFEIITDMINDESFYIMDRPDQQALYDAFSIIGGEQAVGYLSELILKYNLFKDPTLTFIRRAAFEAMTKNNSEKCERVLIKLANSWRPGIKSLAQDAIRKRRDKIYGGI